MRAIKSAFAFAVSSLLLVACAASPGASESTGEAAQAQTSGGAVGTTCMNDASCKSSLVCEPICPVIPGRPHCEIAGGTCEVACTRTSTSLSGSTFTSADGAHSITFTSGTAFSKTDGCPTTGIHCQNIRLETGKYASNGTTITLTPTVGAKSTLSVESHCYEGLLDNSDGVDLYPAPAAN